MVEDNNADFKPPYVSFQMLLNLAERMRIESLPARVDRGYLGNASGTSKAQFLAAAKALQLLDDDLKPTRTFQEFVTQPERRPFIVHSLLMDFYAPVLELGKNATQQQLEERFRDRYAISGSTVRKAIAFFLAAAKFADLEVSPHYSMPRTTAPSGARRRRRVATPVATPAVTPAQLDPMAELKTKYVETLLDKFAQSNGEVDADLADRIERLVGFEAPTPSDS